MQLHPLCSLFPRMSGYEYDCLKLDIAEHGQRHPIIVHEGMILDGGNRFQACIELGIDPKFKHFDGDSIATYVLSANLHRRHLTPGQQAAIVACVQDWAKAHIQGKPKRCNVAPLASVEDRAAQSGASVRTQKTADKVAKAAPELAKAVAKGEMTLPQAEKQAFPKPIGIKKEEEPEIDEKDMLIDSLNTVIEQMSDENDRMKNQLASGIVPVDDQEKLHKRLSELTAENKKLKNINKGLSANLDSLTVKNNELQKQCERLQKKLKSLEK